MEHSVIDFKTDYIRKNNNNPLFKTDFLQYYKFNDKILIMKYENNKIKFLDLSSKESKLYFDFELLTQLDIDIQNNIEGLKMLLYILINYPIDKQFIKKHTIIKNTFNVRTNNNIYGDNNLIIYPKIKSEMINNIYKILSKLENTNNTLDKNICFYENKQKCIKFYFYSDFINSGNIYKVSTDTKIKIKQFKIIFHKEKKNIIIYSLEENKEKTRIKNMSLTYNEEKISLLLDKFITKKINQKFLLYFNFFEDFISAYYLFKKFFNKRYKNELIIEFTNIKNNYIDINYLYQ